jgi:flagellin-like protein
MTGTGDDRSRQTADRPGVRVGDQTGRGQVDGRGQSNVVGVALLLGVTVIAMGALTAGIGTIVSENAASADAARVADGFDRSLRPVETTGTHRGRVEFSDGTLRTVERDLRVSNGSHTRSVAADALVYESGDRRVAFVAGAIVRGTGRGSRLHRPPPITASRGSDGVVIVGAPKLNGSAVGRSGTGAVPATLRTTVTHERVDLGEGQFRVAIETGASRAWATAFERLGATVAATDRDLDGDGVTSVVAEFPGTRQGYLVVHDMRLEVR